MHLKSGPAVGRIILNKKPRGRILLVCAQCDGGDVGESWCGYKWASELSKSYDVTMLTNLFPGDRPPSQQVPLAKVVEWKAFPFVSALPRLNRAIKPWYINFYTSARSWMKQNASPANFDIAHHITPMAMRYPSPCAGLDLPYIMGPVAGTLNTPTGFKDELDTQPAFMKLRGVDSFRLRYDPLLRATFEKAAAVICTAPYAAERLSAFKLNRVIIETEVVHEPTPHLVRQRQANAGELSLLFVGRIVRTKGLRDAIRALALLQDLPNVRLVVAGTGEDLVACQAEVEKNGLSGRVKFVGHKSRSEVDELYRQADAFIFPSFREPTGIVLFEAMAAGLPLVVADYGGPSGIADDETGFRVAPTSPSEFAEGLARAVRTLALDPVLRASMSKAAVRRSTQLGSWEAKFARVSQLYKDIAGITPQP